MDTSLIQPIGPIGIIPIPLYNLPIQTLLQMVMILCSMLMGVAFGVVINKYTKVKWNYKSNLSIIISAVSGGLLFLSKGVSIDLIKGFILLTLLMLASISDIKKREVSNWISFSIALTGLIGITVSDIPFMIVAVVVITIPQLIVAMSKEGSYGGGDIKIMAACAFVLGLESALAAIILGLVTGLIGTAIKRKFKNEKLSEKFPVVPCLAFGSFVAFLFI